VAARFGDWPYGELPVLVATHRKLLQEHPTVRIVNGPIDDLVAEAREVAGGRHVYLDGGALIRQALDSGLVDELTVTVIPVVLGRGYPLFAGTTKRHRFTLVSARSFDSGLVQLVYRPVAEQGIQG
jgi:dihydrofolate reductase